MVTFTKARGKAQSANMAVSSGLPSTQDQAALSLCIDRALQQLRAGEGECAVRILATAPKQARKNHMVCRAFALICLGANHYQAAIEWFDLALKLQRNDPELLAGKGVALQSAGRLTDAIACYDRALALRATDPDTLYNRGAALQALGTVDAALQCYDAALLQRPGYTLALTARCAALETLGRLDEALGCLDAMARFAPHGPETWCRRGDVLQRLGRQAEAIAAYDRALAMRCHYAAALSNRAAVLKDVGRLEDALRDVDAALVLAPEQSEALITRANILQDLGRRQEAEAGYRRALAVQPLITHPAIKRVPDFRALFVFAPMSGNTPIDDMISFADYESNMLMLLPNVDHDVSWLRDRSDVVVNLISDVDRSKQALMQAGELVQRLSKPLVNPPAKVLLTDRERISLLLASTGNCRVPRTRRYQAKTLLETGLHLSYPVVARVAGTHGGDEMERFDTWLELDAFVRTRIGSEFYISEYVDYCSPDGFFRKYRFIFVGGDILPYHLGIDDKWKVHHVSTDMANQPWMQAEEHLFLEHPQAVFGPGAYGTLRAIQTSIGLDYFGIDCALDREGRVVVFEVNASMLVHLRNEAFPYKTAPVLRIKSAFAAMLQDKAA